MSKCCQCFKKKTQGYAQAALASGFSSIDEDRYDDTFSISGVSNTFKNEFKRGVTNQTWDGEAGRRQSHPSHQFLWHVARPPEESIHHPIPEPVSWPADERFLCAAPAVVPNLPGVQGVFSAARIPCS